MRIWRAVGDAVHALNVQWNEGYDVGYRNAVRDLHGGPVTAPGGPTCDAREPTMGTPCWRPLQHDVHWDGNNIWRTEPQPLLDASADRRFPHGVTDSSGVNYERVAYEYGRERGFLEGMGVMAVIVLLSYFIALVIT